MKKGRKMKEGRQDGPEDGGAEGGHETDVLGQST
jgi:hypothetical protein